MSTADDLKKTNAIAIVATALIDEFSQHFTGERSDVVLLFDHGSEALNTWRVIRTPYIFCDYAGLADDMTGFRIIKQIRAEEPNQKSTKIYLMSEKAQANEHNWVANHFGANGTIPKSPTAVEEILSGHKSYAATSINPALKQQFDAIDALFRQFVGPVASQLIAAIQNDLTTNRAKASIRDYTDLLAKKIRTESMRAAFIDAVRTMQRKNQ